MSSAVRYNNESGTLGASLTNSATTITFATAPDFATLSAGQTITLALDIGTTNYEIVYLTAYTANATTGTIARAQEDSTNWPAVSHAQGATWVCAPTVNDFDSYVAGVTVTGTPAANEFLYATSPTAATWGQPNGTYAPIQPGIFTIGSYGSLATDITAAVVAAQAAAVAAGGGVVLYPEGILPVTTGGIVGASNVIHRGVGKKSTILQMSTASNVSFFDMSNTVDMAFEDIGFDWQKGVSGDVRAASLTAFIRTGTIRSRFTRCWFYQMPSITLGGTADDPTSEYCLFQDPGIPYTKAEGLDVNSKHGRSRFNRYHYVSQGIQWNGGSSYGAAPVEDYDAYHNYMDLGWMTSVQVASGSTGTTYTIVANTSVTITDALASFSGLTPGSNQFVRVMPVMATNSGGTVTYDEYTVTDTSAPFNTSTMFRGMLIRTADGRFGVVASVDSTSVVRVEEWLSDTNRDWVSPPSAGQLYTLYNVYLMILTSYTATTLVCSGSNYGASGTQDSLIDLNGNKQSSVATGTRYEVIAPVGSYPMYLSGYCRDIRIDQNLFKRSYGDMIEYDTTAAYASERVDTTNNICIDGSDSGIYVLGRKHKCVGNTIIHCGAVGIGIGTNDSLIDGNHSYDSGWFRAQGGVAQFFLASYTAYNASRNRIVNNHAETVACAKALNGFWQQQGGSGVTDSNYFAGNVGVGNAGGDYALHSGSVTNTGFGWNYGVGWPPLTNNPITVTSNAGTVPVTARVNTFTNSSAATMTVTMAVTNAADGQSSIVRIYDASGAAETITWVNTENSTVSAPTTSNGSTTLPLTVGFIYNAATSYWRCVAVA